MKKNTLLALLTVIAAGCIFAETLTIQIENVDIGKGLVHIALYDNEKSFPKDEDYTFATNTESVAKAVTVTMTDLPKGVYAAAIFQDKNRNGRIDTVLGIPTEKYGFSNNTMTPSWGKNSFAINGDMSIVVKLR